MQKHKYIAYDLELKFTVACVQSRDYHDNYGPDLRIMYLKNSGLDNSKVKIGEYYTIYGYCAYNDNIQATVVIPKYKDERIVDVSVIHPAHVYV